MQNKPGNTKLKVLTLRNFYAGKKPYEGMSGEEVMHFITSGRRLPRISTISPELCVLCFSHTFGLFVFFLLNLNCIVAVVWRLTRKILGT